MFDRLFGPKNPTKLWHRTIDLQLDFDLEQPALNGVRLGDPLNAVSFLGPVEDQAGLQHNVLEYVSLGLYICFDNEQTEIDQFEIVKTDDLLPKFHSYAGILRYQSDHLPLPQMDLRMFMDKFPSPWWKDEDEQEIILFYEFPWIEWQVEFYPDGSFKRINVTSKPLLECSEQRRAYSVTKPWPPRS